MPQNALAGIRIAEFTSGQAGPQATEFLAFMGAEVIKFESAKRLDWTRTMPDPLTLDEPSPDQAPVFMEFNLNKLSVKLNLQDPRGLDIAKRVIKLCDGVLDNFRPGIMKKLGLGYEALRQLKPDLVVVATSMNGATGPEALTKGYAPLFTALSGLGEITGYRDGPPAEVRSTVDSSVAFYSALVLMAALIHRKKTGEGQYIDLSSREVGVCLVGDSVMDYTMNGRVPTRDGNKDSSMAPHNCYRCQGNDKWISICVSNDEEWQNFCRAIGNPGWTKDEKFSSQLSRWQNQEALDPLIEKWTKNYTYHEAMQILQTAGVAAMPSFSADDILGDPHLNERHFTEVLDRPDIGAHIEIVAPWKMSATPMRIVRDAPLMGEHNQYVLGDLLGMSSKEIQKLADDGIFY